MNVSSISQLPVAATADQAFAIFIATAQLMLDPATPESCRMQVEPQLLAQLAVLRALGVFDVFVLRDPALRTLVEDEFSALQDGRRDAA